MNALRDRAQRAQQWAQPQRREPPVDNGKRLATIARTEDQELRVAWCESEGKPFLNIRIWERHDGAWWPSKTGCTVRVRELAAFAEGIGLALDELDSYRSQRGNGGAPAHASPPGGARADELGPDREGMF